jgi:hypothetical protein
MVDRNLILRLGINNDELEQQLNEMYTPEHQQMLDKVMDSKVESLIPGTIVKGIIVSQVGNDVVVELGLKSEGVVEASEFDNPEEIETGREIEVLLEEVDAENGIILSKRKADRIRGWERIITANKEGDVVKGIASKADCTSISASRYFCPLHRSISENPATSAALSVRKSSAKSSKSIRKITTSWSPAENSSKKTARPAKKNCCMKSKSVSVAKASSRISPISAYLWIWAA